MSSSSGLVSKVVLVLSVFGAAGCESDKDNESGGGGADTTTKSSFGGATFASGGINSNPGGGIGPGVSATVAYPTGGTGIGDTSSPGGGTIGGDGTTAIMSGMGGARAGGGASTNGTAGAANTAGSAGSAGLWVVLSDAEVVHVLISVNTGEIEQAQVAVSRAQNPSVRSFAQAMITKHTSATSKAGALATSEQLTPTNNAVSAALKAKSDAVETSLNASTGAQFDRLYMESQVAAHQEVLTLIDTNLLSSAQRATLDALITDMRTTVQTHLAEAQSILAALP